MPSSDPQITELLKAWSAGDAAAVDGLAPLVYAELRRRAGHYMRHENTGITLQPTALVHEVFLRLFGVKDVNWKDRAHFFALAAQMMRRILVDAARVRTAGKRGGGAQRLDLHESIDGVWDRDSQLVELDAALDALARFDPRRAKVVEMRFFGGLSVEETAEVLQISAQSVMRDWRLARAWLLKELSQ